MKIKVSSKGQISIPSDYRKKYNLEAGDVITVNESGDCLILYPDKTCDSNAMRLLLNDLSGIWADMDLDGADYVREIRKGGTRDVWPKS
jgi:AbrB family looped-hinge helix DNA binding protein